MYQILRCIALIFSLTTTVVTADVVAVGDVVSDVSLVDCHGDERRLNEASEAEATVLVFVGVECPLARLYGARLCELSRRYGDRVAFIGIDSNHRDDPDEIKAWQRQFAPTLPVIYDPNQNVADAVGATRNPEVIVLDSVRRIQYRGRIDDQYTTIRRSGNITRDDLAEAIDEVLAGCPVSVAETKVTGCYIDRTAVAGSDGVQSVTYHQHIAPILRRRCVACHRAGQSGPLELTNYDQAHSWLDTIDEVVREKRMPPWYANPEHGDFENFAGLTVEETDLIHRWVGAEGPAGDPHTAAPLPPMPTDEWNIGAPDVVVTIPEPIQIPAQGILDYVYVVVDPGFSEEKWVQAAEVRASNPAVLHHCNVWPQGKEMPAFDFDQWGSVYLAVTAPGRPPMSFPRGTAKRIPPGSKLV